MNRPDEHRPASDESSARSAPGDSLLPAIRRRFERAARQDAAASVDLAQLLPASGNNDRRAAIEIVLGLDLELRLSRGEPRRLEQYGSLIAELGGPAAIPVSLVYKEYHDRRRFGEPVRLEEYERRFPGQYPALVRIVNPRANRRGATVAPPENTPMPHSGADDLAATTAGKSETAALDDTVIPDIDDSDDDAQVVSPPVSGYKIHERLGSGHFGEVWRAEAPGGVAVAIKTIPIRKQLAKHELSALELIKSLRHTFLIQLQAFWCTESQLYIVMELADGSLEDMLRQRQARGETGISHEELLRYIGEAAEALDYLHDQKVLHRDIKPANILVTGGHAKLGDFGLARLLQKDALSMTATSIGTPLYMAPEVWDGKVGRRSDQYSLASTYVELRRGRPAFAADSMIELMRSHQQNDPDLDSLPPAEQRVLARALSKEPSGRFESCRQFARELAAAGQSVAPAAAVGSRRRWLVSAFVVLAAAGGVAAYVMRGQDAPATIALSAPPQVRLTAGGEQQFDVVATGSAQQQVEVRHADLGPIAARHASVDALGLVDQVVRLYGDADRGMSETSFLLQLEPAAANLPAGFRPAADAVLRRVGSRIVYDRIESIMESAPVELLLIEHAGSQDPAPFYMQRTMVSNRAFRAFAESQPLPKTTQWKLGGLAAGKDLPAEKHPQAPVFRVTVDEAHRFAQWIGGRLPSAKQWDKAAGLNDNSTAAGPFKEGWEPGAIAVNRPREGPLPCGAAAHDVAPSGCRDMAGNGREFTRDVLGRREEVPLSDPLETDAVLLRGRSYASPEGPLTYADLRDPFKEQGQLYTEAHPETGFRIVVELPPNAQ